MDSGRGRPTSGWHKHSVDRKHVGVARSDYLRGFFNHVAFQHKSIEGNILRGVIGVMVFSFAYSKLFEKPLDDVII